MISRLLVLSLALGSTLRLAVGAEVSPWSQLPAVPDAEGFASPFAGVSHGALIVAGGANIPHDKWAEVFTKVWHDSVFVLESPQGEWRTGFKLPRPLGYGVSITANDRLIGCGGSDATRHYAECFALSWQQGQIQREALPSLPRPCANACGALVGRTIYIAGGIESPTATAALASFWALDLDAKPLAWRELPTWPGAARMLAVAGSAGDAFYLFSGASLSAGADGKPARTYLRDAYRYRPSAGWQRLADLPRAAVAAPSPAALTREGELLIFSGDDGANVTFQPVKQHPGFPRETLSYDAAKDAWSRSPGLPFSRATATIVEWQGQAIVVNGEERPRVRSPQVWARPSSGK